MVAGQRAAEAADMRGSTVVETFPFGRTDPSTAKLDAARSELQLLSLEQLTVLSSDGRGRIDGLIRELRATYLSTVQTFALLVEAKDTYTAHHLERCRQYATALAAEIDSTLADEDVQHGYLLHDIGKIGVPEALLTKPGPLTAREVAIMRAHPSLGAEIVAPMQFLDARAIDVIRYHHERFDGHGYPDRLTADEIPLAARIFSVVDAFDAMTTDRAYRKALGTDEAVSHLISGAGTQFDPDIVATFLTIMDRLPTFPPEGGDPQA
jgi:HD-GYP domain-containing protein (c-di-GMP phosphodiesterase class II)